MILFLERMDSLSAMIHTPASFILHHHHNPTLALQPYHHITPLPHHHHSLTPYISKDLWSDPTTPRSLNQPCLCTLFHHLHASTTKQSAPPQQVALDVGLREGACRSGCSLPAIGSWWIRR